MIHRCAPLPCSASGLHRCALPLCSNTELCPCAPPLCSTAVLHHPILHLHPLFTFGFETDFHSVVQAGLQLILQKSKALNFPPSCLPKAWVNSPMPLNSVDAYGFNPRFMINKFFCALNTPGPQDPRNSVAHLITRNQEGGPGGRSASWTHMRVCAQVPRTYVKSWTR